MPTHKDRSNLFAAKFCWGGDVIVGKEMNIVLHIHNTERKADTNAEWTMIVDINNWKLVADDARSLNERGYLGGR